MNRWLVICLFVFLGCAEDETERRFAPSYDGQGGAGGAPLDPEGPADDVLGTECDDGDVKACKVVLGEHNGVVTCFTGERRCLEGVWGPCDDPE